MKTFLVVITSGIIGYLFMMLWLATLGTSITTIILGCAICFGIGYSIGKMFSW